MPQINYKDLNAAHLPTQRKHSQPLQVHFDEKQQRQVLAAKTANGEVKKLTNLDTDRVVLPNGKAGAAELSKTKKFFVKSAIASLKAPGTFIKRVLPPTIELGVAGLAGYGAFELTKMVVMAIAPHAAHGVVLGVGLAVVGLLAATVIGYWAYRLYKPASGKLNALIEDHQNFKALVEQDEAAAKQGAANTPAMLPSGKSEGFYNVGPVRRESAKPSRMKSDKFVADYNGGFSTQPSPEDMGLNNNGVYAY